MSVKSTARANCAYALLGYVLAMRKFQTHER